MKRKYFNKAFIAVVITIISFHFEASAQSIKTVFDQFDPRIKLIENNDRIIEATYVDRINRSNDSVYAMEYKFYRNQVFRLTLLKDMVSCSYLRVRIYFSENNSRRLVLSDINYNGNFETRFAPQQSGLYSIELSCSYNSGYEYAYFGLIIDREY